MALASLCSNRDIITPLVPRDEAARCAAGRGCQNFGYSKEDEDAYKESILANTLDLAGIYRRDQLDAINELFQHEFALFGYPLL